MKRLLLFAFVGLLAVGMQATTYHPFVERGKKWCVHGFSMGGDHTVTDYYFSEEEILFERNGHFYEQLRARTQDGKDELVGWFYEENQRVYMYNEEEDKDVLTYDFSLNVGDRFEPGYGDFECCEVTKIDYIVVNGDSLKVINFEANDKTSDTAVRVNGRWIEGIGSEMNPLDGLFLHSAPNSWSYHLAYVSYVSGSTYLPFSFSIPYNGWWGQNLTRGEVDQDYARTHSYGENDLRYELVPDPEHDAYALHVSGIMWLYCGGELYTYCRSERTEDNSAYKLYFQLDTPTDYTDCSSPYHVDLSFPFFLAENKYIVVDERGEHPVAVRETSYHPFVEACKSWCMVNSNQEEEPSDTKVCFEYFDCKEIEVDGKKYLPMYARESWYYECEARRVGLFREDGRKVFSRSSETEEETMLYDFSLEVGETYHHPFYGDFKVTKVGDIVVNNEHLKTISFNGSEEPDWIEGIGSLNSLIWEPVVLPGMFFEEIAYVNYSDGYVEWETIYEHDYKYGDEGVRFPEHYYYLPLSFMLYTPEGHWRGQDLKAAEKMGFDEETDSLEYILRYNTENDDYDLYISGRMILNCGPNHYIYCNDEPTDDRQVQRISLKSENVTPLADCEGGYKVNLVFPHFDKDKTYIITDEQGEHILSAREPEAPYRPFVKEGKMWRTVVFEQDDEPNRFYDYWLYGSTVVEGQEYWKLGRSELSLDIDPSCPAAVDTTFMGVLYEKDGKVYHAAEENGNFLLLYDFNPSVDDEILLDDGFGHQVSYTVIQKGYNDTECFKGLCIKLQVSVPPALINTWMEGVGNSFGPLKNIHGECATGEEALILCTANDEVLYYDENLVMAIDYPDDPDVKKQQLDFTHVVKPRPKAPAANSQHVEASSEEETVTGEYSIKELFVNFKTLAGPYTVTLNDVNDKEVYRKAIETSNTVGLATDLARYGNGTYTLTIENDEEQYITTLNIDDKTGIENVNVNGNESFLNHNYYDLSGRRLTVPPAKGVYIHNGRKIVVK